MDMSVAPPFRASLVKGMWSASGQARETVLPGVVAPDSHVEFVFHLGNTWRMQRAGHLKWAIQPRSFILAQSHGALRFDGEGDVSVIAFRVSPIVASRLLDRPLSGIWNEPIDLDDLIGADARAISEKLLRAPGPRRFAVLTDWVERRLANWGDADWNAQRLFDHVMWRAPSRRLDDIAKDVGWSTRGLRRLFANLADLSPKDVQLAGRHLEACAMLRERPDLGVTEIAGRVGFYDHAAFTHSFGERMGLTPTQFRSESHAFYERRP